MWVAERVVTDGDAYFAELERDLAGATRSIDLESYIVEDDPCGRRVIAALTAAAGRGVTVRLLVDGLGAENWILAAGGHFRGVPWRIYHPLPWTIVRAYVPTLRRLFSRLAAWRAINRRNHRKTCVIDGAVAWIGSINLEQRHCRSLVGELAWRDTAVRVTGPEVANITAAFAHTWRQAWRFGERFLVPALGIRGRLAPLPLTSLVRLNTSRGNRRRLWKDLLRRIAQARTRVWITTPYFVPTEDLLRALERAARTADVRLLLPRVNDVPMMPYIAGVYIERLRAAGVRVWTYPRMVHAKTQVIDEVGLVGSSNLNSRSLHFDLEADVWVAHPESVTALSEAFLADCAISAEIPHDIHPPWRWRVLGWLFLLARRWM